VTWSKSSSKVARAWVSWKRPGRRPRTIRIPAGYQTRSTPRQVGTHFGQPFYKSSSYAVLPTDFRKNKNNDVLQMLVSIYDSKDLFVKELQVLLAQRLLAIRDYDLDREVKERCHLFSSCA
jgi:hypothetical protein